MEACVTSCGQPAGREGYAGVRRVHPPGQLLPHLGVGVGLLGPLRDHQLGPQQWACRGAGGCWEGAESSAQAEASTPGVGGCGGTQSPGSL